MPGPYSFLSGSPVASETEIANLALRHLGVGKTITSLTEGSEESQACNTFYATCRDAVLRDFQWPFATVLAAMQLVHNFTTDAVSSTTVGPEWSYSYRLPSDCLHLRRILSGTRNDTRATRVAYRRGRDSQGGLVFTDIQNAQIEYTFRETDTGRFDPDFQMALSWRLAAYIAPTITGGDQFGRGAEALKMYMMEIEKAKNNALNEQQDEELPDSELINARD